MIDKKPKTLADIKKYSDPVIKADVQQPKLSPAEMSKRAQFWLAREQRAEKEKERRIISEYEAKKAKEKVRPKPPLIDHAKVAEQTREVERIIREHQQPQPTRITGPLSLDFGQRQPDPDLKHGLGSLARRKRW